MILHVLLVVIHSISLLVLIYFSDFGCYIKIRGEFREDNVTVPYAQGMRFCCGSPSRGGKAWFAVEAKSFEIAIKEKGKKLKGCI